MKLTYNYTQGSFMVHMDDIPRHIMVTEIGVESPANEESFAFMADGDLCETFDISHWTAEDMIEFANHSTGDQLGQLEGLSELQWHL